MAADIGGMRNAHLGEPRADIGGSGGFLAGEFRMLVQMMTPLGQALGKVEGHGEWPESCGSNPYDIVGSFTPLCRAGSGRKHAPPKRLLQNMLW
jgi:hypothetical protein